MDLDEAPYLDIRALADGYLVEVPFALFARVTRSVWDAHALDATSGTSTLEIVRQTWVTALSLPARPDGWRVLDAAGRTVCLVPNELGGLTLMFPEDW